MRKFVIALNFQVIVATSIISASAMIGLPVLAQDSEEIAPTASIEVVAEAEPAAEPIEAITADAPNVETAQLEILLKPLPLENVEAEAQAWYTLLQEKAQEISDTEIAIKMQEGGEDINGAVDTEKEKLVVVVTELKAEQTILASRLGTVLDNLDAKGGDSTLYRQYVEAASGLEFSLTNTEGVGLRFMTWLQSEEGGIRLGLNLLKFSGILVATLVITPRAGKLANAALLKVNNISNLFRDFAVMVVKRGVMVGGGLLALASLGVNLAPILAVVGGASFVLAFALQSNLGNFASGLMLLVSKPFDVGDEIKVAGYWAFVDSISLASTRLKDFGGSIITLPNNTVWGGDIINYTHAEKRKISIGINVKFTQDVEQVQNLWFDITAANPKVLSDPSPSIFPWNSTYDYYIYIGLTAWTRTDEYWGVYVELLKTLQKQIEAHGIALTAPVQELHLDQASRETIEAESATVLQGA